MYRGAISDTVSNASKPSFLGACLAVANWISYFVCFLVLQVAGIIVTQWLGFFLFQDTFFHEDWMSLVLLTGGAFLGGVLIGNTMGQSRQNRMGLFAAALLSILLISGFVLLGAQLPHQLLPQMLDTSAKEIAFIYPAIEISGMLCCSLFSLSTNNESSGW